MAVEREHQKNCVAFFKEAFGHVLIAFLSGCVPNFEHDSVLLKGKFFDFEVKSDGGSEIEGKLFLAKSADDAGFSDGGVSDCYDFVGWDSSVGRSEHFLICIIFWQNKREYPLAALFQKRDEILELLKKLFEVC